MNDRFRPERITEELVQTSNDLGTVQMDGLTKVRDMQEKLGALLQHEARRLEKKAGKTDRRVQQIKSVLKRNRAIIQDLEVEREIASIQVPDVPEKGALIHGRIVDASYRGLTALTVYLEDENGNPLRFLGNVETQSSGYYALPIDAEALKRLSELQGAGAFLAICTRQGQVVYRHPDPVKPSEGELVLVEVVLNRDDLTPVEGPKWPVP